MTTTSYVTADEFKNWAGITTAAHDTTCNLIVDSTSRAIDSFCGRRFYQDTSTSSRVYQAKYPDWCITDDISTTVGLVVALDQADNATFNQTLTAADYELDPPGGILEGSDWPYTSIRATGNIWFPTTGYRRNRIQVTAKWGWPSVPTDLKQAAYILALDLFKMKDSPLGVANYGEVGILRIRTNLVVSQLIAPYQQHAVMGA